MSMPLTGKNRALMLRLFALQICTLARRILRWMQMYSNVCGACGDVEHFPGHSAGGLHYPHHHAAWKQPIALA